MLELSSNAQNSPASYLKLQVQPGARIFETGSFWREREGFRKISGGTGGVFRVQTLRQKVRLLYGDRLGAPVF